MKVARPWILKSTRLFSLFFLNICKTAALVRFFLEKIHDSKKKEEGRRREIAVIIRISRYL